MSGKEYLQGCNSSKSSSSLSSSDGIKHQTNQTMPNVQDLNFPPLSSPSKPLLNLLHETNLEQKLISSSSSNYQSVYTLDKVESALKRVEKKLTKKRSSLSSTSKSKSLLSKSFFASPSYSFSSSSIKGSWDGEGDREKLITS